MKRNCNLELRLVTPSAFSRSMMEMENASPKEKQQQQQQQQQMMTIFYKGKVAACDVTELQARAIILLASREVEDQKSSNNMGGGSEPTSPAINSPVYSPTNVVSMKRSLQRFLEKRKTRAQATSPYPIDAGRRN